MGAFAATNIKKNSLIIEYLGEKIFSDLGEMRNFRDGTDMGGQSYIFTFRQEYSNKKDNLDSDHDEVDSKNVGNLARYLNHAFDDQPECNVIPMVKFIRNYYSIGF